MSEGRASVFQFRRCGHRWKAPRLLQPEFDYLRRPVTVMVEQVCAEQQGHDGPHRSLTNVTEASRAA